MSPPLAPMFEHWHEFFLLLGTAAATLIALLFVAVSIGAGMLSAQRAAGTRTFMSPVVVHFTAVLVACGLALIPTHTRASFGLLIGAGAIAGAAYAVFISIRLLRGRDVDWGDRLAYGVATLLSYVAAVVAARLFFAGSPHAPEVLAGPLLALLVINIRNAWDLTVFFARQHAGGK